MTLYINAITAICRPLVHGYNSGVFGAALNAAHSLWWIESRRQDWHNEPDKIFFPIQLSLSSYLLDNAIGTLATSSILNIVKLDDVNDAYSRRRESYTMIRRAWVGEFTLKKHDSFDKFFLTLCKILDYIKASFCFFMTCIDAAKALEFNDQAKIEALSNLINNTVRVGNLLLYPEHAFCLKLKLRHNVDLIKSCCRVNHDTALEYIENIYRELLEIQKNPVIKGAKKLIDATKTGASCASYVQKAGTVLGNITNHVVDAFTGPNIKNQKKSLSSSHLETLRPQHSKKHT